MKTLWPALLLLLAPQDDLRPGLVGDYFNIGHEVRDFPHLPAGKRPCLRRVDASIAFDEGSDEFAQSGLRDHFYVRWTGILRVPSDGTYTFFSKSDDGSAVWIDGARVVDNGGLHDFKVEKSGKVNLTKGDHELKVEFLENDSMAGIIVSWQPPDAEREALPAASLFHKKDPALDKD